jgi:DNA replication and repair protein RecF
VHLELLEVENVRNVERARLTPHRRLTALVGDNGQGKTNLLEAVHLAAALRPLRPLERARDLLRFGSERGAVRARFDLDGPLDVEVGIEPKGRRARIAGKLVRDVSEVARRIGVVAFTPEDLAIVRAGPDKRRRALDAFAFGLEPGFADVARRYERALESRNKVLRTTPDRDVLDAYTGPLIEAGVELARARARATARWAPGFTAAVAGISDGALDAQLDYGTGFADAAQLRDDSVEALRAAFADKLAASAAREAQRPSTAVGPHLDDLVIRAGDRRARRIASQGEARALVLALKIAAVQLYTEVRGAAPLLLLDDVAGELDPTRAAKLFEVAFELGAQAFVTATHEGALPDVGERRVVRVREGAVVA